MTSNVCQLNACFQSFQVPQSHGVAQQVYCSYLQQREFVMIPTKLTKQARLLVINKGRCLIIREVVPNANHRAHGVHPLCKRCLPPLLCSPPPPPPCFNYPEEVVARQIACRPLTPRSSSAADQLQNNRSSSSLPLSNLHRASTTGAHA